MSKKPDTATEDLISVTDVATLLGMDIAWTAAWLERIGVPVDVQGRISRKRLVRALKRMGDKGPTPEKVNAEVKAAMGDDGTSGREWFEKELERHGLVILQREGRGNARLTVTRPGAKHNARIYVSVSKTMKTQGSQVGFLTGPDEKGDVYDFYALVSVALGKVWLRSRKDMQARWRKKHPTAAAMGKMTVTIPVNSDVDLLETRISEVVRR